MGAQDYEAKTEKLLAPITEAMGISIYDVEYVKEGSDYYLRAYIDKPGGVNIQDCEDVSRALSDKLDEEDFVKEAYILEVSSPGLGRRLTRERHFLASIGQEIEVKTYKPIDGNKEFVGILRSYDKGTFEIEGENGIQSFTRTDTAMVRLTFDF